MAYIPGQQTGPFGGPGGSTKQAMMQLVQSMLMGKRKKEFGEQWGQMKGDGPMTRESISQWMQNVQNPTPEMVKTGTALMNAMPTTTTPSLQKGSREVTGPDGKTYVQEFNFNPDTGARNIERTYLKPEPQPSVSERETIKRQKAVGKLEAMDPNEAYMTHGYKMNEDGSLYIDPVNNAPVKLPPFHKVMGKRGQVKAAKQLGENWDDSKQLMALLNDPKVAENMKTAEKEIGFWDRVSGKWNNKINLWMQKRGIGKQDKTFRAITRMQRLASQERKEFLGVAVTGTELESTLAWMPNAGDSLSTMMSKTQLMVDEGEEVFRRWIDIYKDVTNMGPFYKSFGLQRFPEETQATSSKIVQPTINTESSASDEADAYLKSIGL